MPRLTGVATIMRVREVEKEAGERREGRETEVRKLSWEAAKRGLEGMEKSVRRKREAEKQEA